MSTLATIDFAVPQEEIICSGLPDAAREEASGTYVSSMMMTAVVSGSRASKTCGMSPGYSR